MTGCWTPLSLVRRGPETLSAASGYTTPQLELLELDATQWIKVQQRAAQHRTRRMVQLAEQLPLIHVGSVV